MSLKSIDGYAVDPIESLKAEWLYSQGRGRQFRVGEHTLLAHYLASVCPLSGESLENESDRKLRLILSKAQHHQQQLNQQSDSGSVHSLSSVGMSPSPAARRRLSTNRTSSPRRPSSSRNSMRIRSPDRIIPSCHPDSMVSSCHATSMASSSCHTLLGGDDVLMTQSLDPNMLSNSLSNKLSHSDGVPLQGVEEDQTEKAAICIQRLWRGYRTRNLNKKATNILKSIEMMRTNKYIQKLSTDMEATRTALESEHKLQLLQMQAINALWKKVVSLQPGVGVNRDVEGSSNANTDVVNNLAQTCTLLHSQVQQLQDSMSEIKRCMSSMQPKPNAFDNGVGTQTEISAVHTPAGEANTFPYARANRPQSLPIHQTIHEGNENKSFASNLVDSVLKKVSQSTDTTDDEINTDILNSNENPEFLNSNDNPDVFKSCEEIMENEYKEFNEKVEVEYKDVIEEAAIDGEVCEETLCKELHSLIKTESRRESDAHSEKEKDSEEHDHNGLNCPDE